MSEKPSTSPAAAEQRLRVEDLPATHAALARALGEAGIGGERAHQIFDRSIKAVCLGCGLSISGEELGQIAMAGGEHPTTENKLDRLRLGYCGRLGCDSKFYTLRCAPAEGIDPAKLLERTAKLRDVPTTEVVDPEPDTSEPRTPWWKLPRTRIIAGSGVVALYLGWRIFGPNGMAPLVKYESPYHVETNAAVTYGTVSGSSEVVR
ncbi:MAG TPA: hypothetical protein VMF06_12245 [Candidatus Limnocylindria bacterium]|jgi:hypothetical protein|nr:hypothetical protein [Candidatus Limnocylindria bacterium]